jgi:hypothetical protein
MNSLSPTREQVTQEDPRLDPQPTFGKGPGSLLDTPAYPIGGGDSDELGRAPGNRFSGGRATGVRMKMAGRRKALGRMR